MIEPHSISLPTCTNCYYTEEKDGVRYSGSFILLNFNVSGERVDITGTPVLRKWRKVKKVFAAFASEKEKWIVEWSVSGPYDYRDLNKIGVVDRRGSNMVSFDGIINGGLKRGLVITDDFVQSVMAKAVAQVAEFHANYAPQILRPNAVRRVA